MRFQVGQLVSTPGALRALAKAGQSPLEFVSRHCQGDWGEVDREDATANEHAVDNDERILSAYRTCLDAKVWVITEADRSATTILLPDEY
jgi:hypothetical protein